MQQYYQQQQPYYYGHSGYYTGTQQQSQQQQHHQQQQMAQYLQMHPQAGYYYPTAYGYVFTIELVDIEMRAWWRIRGPNFALINPPFWILRTLFL